MILKIMRVELYLNVRKIKMQKLRKISKRNMKRFILNLNSVKRV
jgi:hypothetical protein